MRSHIENARLRRLQRSRQRAEEAEAERPRRRHASYQNPERWFNVAMVLCPLLGTLLSLAAVAYWVNGDIAANTRFSVASTTQGHKRLLPAPEVPQAPIVPAATHKEEDQPTPIYPEQPRFATIEEAGNYVRQMLPNCPEKISLFIDGGAQEEHFHHLAEIIEQAGDFCSSGLRSGDEMTLNIEHNEDTLLIARHRGKIPPERLTPARQDLYEKALSIVREAARNSSDEYTLALALHDWITLNSHYVNMVHPDGAVSSIIVHGEGLCECYARTFRVLAELAGLECRYITGICGDELHGWNLIKINGKWAHVDCTYDDPTPDQPGQLNRYYFALSDAAISRTHQWNRSLYPACTSEELWYAATRQPVFPTLDAAAAELIRLHQSEGITELASYVDELERAPENLSKLLLETVNKHGRSLNISQNAPELSPGFIILSCGKTED